MSTVIPSPLGSSVTDILALLMQKRRLDLERQRVGQEGQRIALEAGREQRARQQQAFTMLMQLAPFVSPGSTVAENEFLHPFIKDAGIEFDPADVSGFGGLQFRPETWETVIAPILADRARAIFSDEDPEMAERLANKIMLGESVTGDELDLRSRRTSIISRSLDFLTQDDESLGQLFNAVGRRALGLEQPVTVRIPDETQPGGFREVTWDTPQAASIGVQIWRFMEEQRAAEGAASAERMNDMVTELIEQAKQMDVVLGRPKASQIVSTLQADDPSAALNELYQAEPDPAVKSVIQMFAGGKSIADNSFMELLRQTPEGQQVANFIDFVTEVASVVPAEQRGAFIERMSEAIGQFVPMARYVHPGMFTRRSAEGLIVSRGAPPAIPGLGAPTTAPGVPNPNVSETQDLPPQYQGVPPEALFQAGLQSLVAGEKTPLQLRQQLGTFADQIIEMWRMIGGATGDMEADLPLFMEAISGHELRGHEGDSLEKRSQITNERTGAHGLFQILPENWPAWSRETFGRVVEKTPANQEAVARYKMTQYFRKYGRWDAVAAAWYGGEGAADRWIKNPNDPFFDRKHGPKQNEESIRSYVNRVMARMGGGAAPGRGGGGGSSPGGGAGRPLPLTAEPQRGLSTPRRELTIPEVEEPPAAPTDVVSRRLADRITTLTERLRRAEAIESDDPRITRARDKTIERLNQQIETAQKAFDRHQERRAARTEADNRRLQLKDLQEALRTFENELKNLQQTRERRPRGVSVTRSEQDIRRDIERTKREIANLQRNKK